jgi:transcriptional regulator with XRE-family HTH domain
MKIKSKLVVETRNKKGWSQQQLSIVSGLSLRTIQRVENEGKASLETLKSLASTFEINHNELVFGPENRKGTPRKLAASVALIISLMTSILLISTSTASPRIEVRSTEMQISHDQKTNIFLGDVSFVIPDMVPFEVLSMEDTEPFHLQIEAENTIFLTFNTQITRVKNGTLFRAEKVQTRLAY